LGLAYLLLNASVPRGVMALLAAMTLALAVLAILATLIIFNTRLRHGVLSAAERLVLKISRRDISSRLAQFEESLAHGVEMLGRRRGSIAIVMALTFLDWTASVAVLGWCFAALGSPLPPAVLASGFVIGVMAGVISLVPGGLGVQEGSMAGVFVLLGAPFETAALSAILFRALYYFLPYFISLAFYARLMRKDSVVSSLEPTDSK
jgi:uncharacterized protein (TIRG00374 family)